MEGRSGEVVGVLVPFLNCFFIFSIFFIFPFFLRFFFFLFLFLLFLFCLRFFSFYLRFFTFGQVTGNAPDGRSRHQSFRVWKVNLATLNVATHTSNTCCEEASPKRPPAVTIQNQTQNGRMLQYAPSSSRELGSLLWNSATIRPSHVEVACTVLAVAISNCLLATI